MKPVCVARRRLLLGALTLALAACASTPPPAQPARPKVALALGGGRAATVADQVVSYGHWVLFPRRESAGLNGSLRNSRVELIIRPPS